MIVRVGNVYDDLLTDNDTVSMVGIFLDQNNGQWMTISEDIIINWENINWGVNNSDNSVIISNDRSHSENHSCTIAASLLIAGSVDACVSAIKVNIGRISYGFSIICDDTFSMGSPKNNVSDIKWRSIWRETVVIKNLNINLGVNW